jgi:hypothetical protein
LIKENSTGRGFNLLGLDGDPFVVKVRRDTGKGLRILNEGLHRYGQGLALELSIR